MLTLYKNIKKLREELGMSQDELAEKTGYTSRSSIAKIEKGLVDLQQSKIINFANALGVTPSQLMGWDEPIDNKVIELTEKDQKDIKKDLDSIMGKLTSGEAGPAAYDGEELDPEAADLFREELEIALKRLKIVNKEKYTPKKYKK